MAEIANVTKDTLHPSDAQMAEASAPATPTASNDIPTPEVAGVTPALSDALQTPAHFAPGTVSKAAGHTFSAVMSRIFGMTPGEQSQPVAEQPVPAEPVTATPAAEGQK